jgi:hypothetical protein
MDSDWQQKMCKKVARLTKVIFMLNTKNDEYESNLKSVVSAYETEMDSMAKQANLVIAKYREALEQSKKDEDLDK